MIVLLAGLLALLLMVSGFACGRSDPPDDPSPVSGPPPTVDQSRTPGLPPTVEQATTPQTDREALVVLYDATGGPNWSRSTNWLSDKPIGEWEGVTTDAEGRVIHLNLAANELRGEIPRELGRLTNLRGLLLSENLLSGEIPSELGQLSNLERLRVESNQLVGEIPSWLGDLSNLKALGIADNHLTGCVPAALHDSLKENPYDLGRWSFCGIIPTPTPEAGAVRVAPVATPLPASQAALAATVGPVPTGEARPTAPTFRIGVMLSLTGPGEVYGKLTLQAMEMAVDEINAAGGVAGGELELVVEDSMCKEEAGVASYRRLASEQGIRIILGTTCSGPLSEVASLAEGDGVVLFSSSATNPEISHAGANTFRTAISEAQAGTDAAALMWADGVRGLAAISLADRYDYGESLVRDTLSRFEMLGGRVVGKESVVVGKESVAEEAANFTVALESLLRTGPDGLFVVGLDGAYVGSIVRQVRQLGYEGPIYGDIDAVGSTALEVAGDSATGMKAIVRELDPSNERAVRLIAGMKDRNVSLTLLWGTRWYFGSAYDVVHIAAECLRKTEDDQDAQGFRECLSGITWNGTIGNGYSFDENGDVVGVSHAVVVVLPPAERTEENRGYRIVGPTPSAQ